MKNNAKRRGQGLIEYLILVCLIAVSTIAVVSIVGKNVKEQYANISSAMRGDKEIKLTKPDPKTYETHGMDDFMDGAQTQK